MKEGGSIKKAQSGAVINSVNDIIRGAKDLKK